MANSGAPYPYPSPDQIRAYASAAQGASAGAQQRAIDTSNMGAPQGILARARRWLGITILGADGANVFMPPQQPLQPIGQSPDAAVIGRPWDYPVGWNTRVTPRLGASIGFPTMKALADGYDVLRLLIERIKDDIIAQRWSIVPLDQKAKADDRCKEVQQFLEYPDQENCWDDWLRMLLEQVIVYDAASIWLRPDRKGDLWGLDIIDGSLIQPKIMADGRLPPPDVGPAYQQVIKGLPAVDYIRPVPIGTPTPTDPAGYPFPELLYRPRNKRVDSPYGFSPVEQMITTINIALKREEYLLAYYTQGSTPDLIFGVPDTWNADQIVKFSNWWDSLLAGNLQERRKARFIPGSVKPFDVREKALTDETDQWLIRVMCFAFGLSPMPFIKMMNRATGEQHATQQKEEGTGPQSQYVASLIKHVIDLKFGYRDLTFRWEEEDSTDPLQEAQRFKIYLDAKVFHPDEIRAKLGEDAMSTAMRSQMDMATFAETVNATVLPPDQQAEADQRASDQADAAAARQDNLADNDAKRQANAPPKASATEKLAALLKALPVQPAPVVNVDVAPPAVHVDAPAIHVDAPDIKVDAPAIKLGDTFVDVGATNVSVKPEAHKQVAALEGGQRSVETMRRPDGTIVSKITHTRTVEQTRSDDGTITAKGD